VFATHANGIKVVVSTGHLSYPVGPGVQDLVFVGEKIVATHAGFVPFTGTVVQQGLTVG